MIRFWLIALFSFGGFSAKATSQLSLGGLSFSPPSGFRCEPQSNLAFHCFDQTEQFRKKGLLILAVRTAKPTDSLKGLTEEISKSLPEPPIIQETRVLQGHTWMVLKAKESQLPGYEGQYFGALAGKKLYMISLLYKSGYQKYFEAAFQPTLRSLKLQGASTKLFGLKLWHLLLIFGFFLVGASCYLFLKPPPKKRRRRKKSRSNQSKRRSQ